MTRHLLKCFAVGSVPVGFLLLVAAFEQVEQFAVISLVSLFALFLGMIIVGPPND